MSRAGTALLHVGMPLTVGAALYVGWRDESLIGWRWAEAIGIDAPARALRALLRGLELPLPDAIVYVLPDALWVYALTFALARLHARSAPLERALVLSVPVLLGPGAELAQAAVVLSGTFDVLDLFATIAALVAALSLGARDRAPLVPEAARAMENA